VLGDEAREDEDRQRTRQPCRGRIVHSARRDGEQQRHEHGGRDRRDVLR